MKTEAFICLDIGGTNCRIGLVNEELNIFRQRIISTKEMEKNGIIEALTVLLEKELRDVSEEFHILGIVIGVPATVDKKGKMILSCPNIHGLDKIPLADILGEKLGLPVILEKDVNLLLLADINNFALAEDASVVGIYYGTGIGNSIYFGGQIWRGKNGVAGEIGHIPQLYSKQQCGCGNPSCIEPLGGGRRLTKLCEEVFMGTSVGDIYSMHRDTSEILEQLEAMAIAVASEVNILDPDYVIIGGGLPMMNDFPKKIFEEMIKKHTRAPYPRENLELLYSEGGQENGLVGAGILGWNYVKKY